MLNFLARSTLVILRMSHWETLVNSDLLGWPEVVAYRPANELVIGSRAASSTFCSFLSSPDPLLNQTKHIFSEV